MFVSVVLSIMPDFVFSRHYCLEKRTHSEWFRPLTSASSSNLAITVLPAQAYRRERPISVSQQWR